MGYITHKFIHAYDFYIRDHIGQPAKTPASTSNSEYYTFGMPMRSPVDGRVLQIENEQPDTEPLKMDGRRANKVTMSVLGNDELQLHMLHFQKDSVSVQAGQKLKTGETVALAGNSGMTGFSHLHLELTKGQRPGLTGRPTSPANTFTQPIAFEKAIVSLNPVADDPWTRYVENWEIRANVFVEDPNKADAGG